MCEKRAWRVGGREEVWGEVERRDRGGSELTTNPRLRKLYSGSRGVGILSEFIPNF